MSDWIEILKEELVERGAAGPDRFPVAYRDFGRPLEEARALRRSAGVLFATGYGRLEIRGARGLEMLQGQVTNDVSAWKPGDGGYACHLDRKGRMVADMILRVDDEATISLILHRDRLAHLQKKLTPVAMLSDCEVQDQSAQGAFVMVAGVQAAAGLEGLGTSAALKSCAVYKSFEEEAGGCPVRLQRIPDLGVPTFLVDVSRDRLRDFGLELLEAGAFVPAGFEAYDSLRVEAGIPLWGIDMSEDNLAPECGIPYAISYAKGCYVGQETVARLRTYGQANKLLRGFYSDEALAPGTKLTDENGKEAGWVTSSAYSRVFERPIAMGYTRRAYSDPGRSLLADKNRVEVAALPFVAHDQAPLIPK